jgi:hypothetical protein
MCDQPKKATNRSWSVNVQRISDRRGEAGRQNSVCRAERSSARRHVEFLPSHGSVGISTVLLYRSSLQAQHSTYISVPSSFVLGMLH